MRKNVSFKSNGLNIAGHLYLPEDMKKGEKYPAIVTVTPVSGIKEQTSGLYAQKMSEKGYVALAFDNTSYGESEGQPRFDENPFAKSEDIKSAVTFLSGLDEVDPQRIGAIGICAGGGYVAYTAATDKRIKAVGTVSAYFDLRGMVTSGFAGDWVSLLKEAGKARIAYASGGEPQYIPMLPEDPTFPGAREGLDYYCTSRGEHPNWQNKTLLWSYDKMVQYSALDVIHMVSPTPMLIIAGSQAATLEQSKLAYEHAKEPKELVIIDGGTHFSLYDQERHFSQAIEKFTKFFKVHL
ncbi:alpha/beta hydrolase [Pelosinus sp. UFO1]|uniref:alpha/beta hydrolase n=1 Tax=Pelosinus sp. UFO1 TaxID=484770 RepID=UPI0004D13EB1|nr:alpha/beta hydrolase [Pelosinus sp. UFO1]AIF52949.1 hypothetical protein UFO1_3406 [Pelosinus sp. UFO1]